MSESKDEKTPILPTYFKADTLDSQQTKPTQVQKRKWKFFFAVLILLVVAAALLAMIIALAVVYGRRNVSLVDSIKSDQLLSTLTTLQDTRINNSRSVLNGFNDSAEYIFKQLQDNGYEPERQYFTVPVFENERPGEALFRGHINNPELDLDFIESTQFNVMTYSGSCDNCRGNLIDKTEDNNFGCDSGWNANGQIVLMTYNSSKGCSLYQKASNALAGGALAVIFERDVEDTAGPPASRVYEKTESGEIVTLSIASIGVTNAVGQLLRSFNEATISTFTKTTIAWTYNVLARTTSGTNESVIVVGSHLDSVPAGPGINDNGSGTSANLQLAIELSNLGIQPKNQILFAWWGAEELGLLGSTYFVAQLAEEKKNAIALNLNFDMIASPNFVRGIYNGSSANESILSASTTIQDLFIQYFENNGLAYIIVPFTGRSDYGPFIEVNIPAGGLFTGAEEPKTQEQYDMFGGLVNAALDPCYHRFCDDINNINMEVFQQMTKAAAYTLEILANEENLEDYLENGINS